MAQRFWFLMRFLVDFPRTDAAFAAGGITMDHAATVIRALLTLPVELRDTVEPFLLDD